MFPIDSKIQRLICGEYAKPEGDPWASLIVPKKSLPVWLKNRQKAYRLHKTRLRCAKDAVFIQQRCATLANNIRYECSNFEERWGKRQRDPEAEFKDQADAVFRAVRSLGFPCKTREALITYRYLESLSILMDMPMDAPSIKKAQTILKDMNLLIERHRNIEIAADRMRPLGILDKKLEDEAGALQQELDNPNADPAKKEILRQNLQLKQQRIKNTALMLAQFSRASALLDSMEEVFDSLLNALKIEQATSAVGAMAGAFTEVKAVQASIVRLNQQTDAFEQAIQEVMQIPGA